MDLVVVDRLDPRGEQGVELEQRRGRGELPFGQVFGAGTGDFDEELITSAKKPLTSDNAVRGFLVASGQIRAFSG
jgi:hypothetical protein